MENNKRNFYNELVSQQILFGEKVLIIIKDIARKYIKIFPKFLPNLEPQRKLKLTPTKLLPTFIPCSLYFKIIPTNKLLF